MIEEGGVGKIQEEEEEEVPRQSTTSLVAKETL